MVPTRGAWCLRSPCARRILYLVALYFLCALAMWLYRKRDVWVQAVDYLDLPAIYVPDLHCHHCNNFNFTYVINNSRACLSRDVFLLFLVTSPISGVKQRNAIRSTWGAVKSHQGHDVMTLFLVGSRDDKTSADRARQSIGLEYDHYGDLIQVDMFDNYKNLTHKTGAVLHWAAAFCPGAKYIVKSDDDSFNVPGTIVNDLALRDETGDFLAGICSSGNAPYRQPKHKWYDPEESYPGSYYPLHMKGRAYVMSRPALVKLLTSSHDVIYNKMEDVFWTGLCRTAAGVKCTCYDGFYYKLKKTELKQCDVANYHKLVNIHYVDAVHMTRYWRWYNNSEVLKQCQVLTESGLPYRIVTWIPIPISAIVLAWYIQSRRRSKPDRL